MGKNKKTETIVAVLIPVLVFLLMAALTVVLWDAHNPSQEQEVLVRPQRQALCSRP